MRICDRRERPYRLPLGVAGMAELQDVERWVFGFELWLPTRIQGHRLVLGHEARHKGRLMALRSEVYAPGPFDTLRDVEAIIADRLRAAREELEGSSTDPLAG